MRFPMTSKFLIDEQDFLDIIDQLRVAIPEEIKQARRITVEKDRVMGQVQTEADKILITAQERAAVMLQDNEVVRMAEQRAQAILTEAEARAEEVRQGADQYALDILQNLETEMSRTLAQVKKGKATLQKVQQENAMLREPVRPTSPVRGDSREYRGVIDDFEKL
jgi:cell division septum initiation protein DivIVA